MLPPKQRPPLRHVVARLQELTIKLLDQDTARILAGGAPRTDDTVAVLQEAARVLSNVCTHADSPPAPLLPNEGVGRRLTPPAPPRLSKYPA